MTPAERLRSVTRRNVADERLAAEAADALAGFASEPASLVVACRRVLAHHRTHGALWWVCARILAAAEPSRAAREAVQLLEGDNTADRLGASLPLQDEGDVLAVIGWPPAVDDALVERMDLDAIALRVDGADPLTALRDRRSDRIVRVVEPWDVVAARIPHLLVAATAIGPATALVPAGTGDAIATLGRSVQEVWMIGGVGRVLPGRLYDAMREAARGGSELFGADDDTEELSLEQVDRLVGTRGVERPLDAASRTDCPVVPELLRPLD